jgi:hypothetical protein
LLQPEPEDGLRRLEALNERLRQNTVQEKLSNIWLDYIVKKHELAHV